MDTNEREAGEEGVKGSQFILKTAIGSHIRHKSKIRP